MNYNPIEPSILTNCINRAGYEIVNTLHSEENLAYPEKPSTRYSNAVELLYLEKKENGLSTTQSYPLKGDNGKYTTADNEANINVYKINKPVRKNDN